MVTAGKIFRLSDETELKGVISKLKGYRRVEEFKDRDRVISLVTEVSDIQASEDAFTGFFSKDYISYAVHRGTTSAVPRTVRSMFSFVRDRGRVLLVILEKRRLANQIANQVSQILYGQIGGVVEARIPPETLREFQSQNSESTKITFFDNVDIPSISKLSLYGSDLASTSLFGDYLKHGDLWYAIVASRKHGHIVGITRNSCVTVFNRVDREAYLSYVTDEVFPLIT